MATNSTINTHLLVMCANMIVRKGDKYLMMKRSPKKIIAPGSVHTIGGKVEKDEDPYMAAQRELFEEAGIVAIHIKLIGVVTEVKYQDTPNWQIFYFLGEYSTGELTQTDEGTLMWLTKKEILESNLIPSTKRIMPHMLDTATDPVFARFTYDADDNLIDGEMQISGKYPL